MKIKEGFVIREVAGNVVVVPTGELVKELPIMITLNSVGKFIWEILTKEDLSKEEVVKKIILAYNIDEEIAKRDVEKFIENLITNQILENY